MTQSCRDIYVIIFKIFFDLTIFKFFIEFVTILLLFYVLGFFVVVVVGHEPCGNLAP